MSEGTFVRELKMSNIKDDVVLLEFVKKYTTTKKISGIRALQDFVVKLIHDGINDSTLKELFNVLNVVVPAVANDSVVQDVYKNIRHAVKSRYGANSEMHNKSLSLMKFDILRWRAIKAEYMRKVAQDNKEPTQYGFELIKQILKTTANGDLADLLIFLQLCCGARFGELVYFSTFEKTNDNINIRQVGILKSKDESKTVEKPILYITPAKF